MSRAPFDQSDPVEQMADRFRKQVVDLAMKATEDPEYAALTPEQQANAWLAGVMTGLIGVLLASVTPQSHDMMMMAIEDYLPLAREQAEGIMKNKAH